LEPLVLYKNYHWIGRSSARYLNHLKIVLRLGGSILGSPPDAEVVKRYSDVVSRISRKGHKTVVVVGGGAIARQYIDAARSIGLPHEEQDSIAIQASRLNARLVGMSLGVDTVATSPRAAISDVAKHGVAVMGGLRPGITTDTVATLVGEAWKSDLIIKASDQDGIYSADPRKDPDAKLLRTISYSRVVEILGGRHSPGIHSIVDPVAVERISRSKLKLIVVNGNQPENVIRAISGERVGTAVG
jgi:uridylate kinase